VDFTLGILKERWLVENTFHSHLRDVWTRGKISTSSEIQNIFHHSSKYSLTEEFLKIIMVWHGVYY